MDQIEYIFPILASIGFYLCFSNVCWLGSVTKGGKVWGVEISASERLMERRKKGKIVAVIGIIILSITSLRAFIVLIGCLFGGQSTYVIVCAIVLLVLFLLILLKCKRVGEYAIREIDLSALEQFPIIQRVNELIAGANKFYIERSDIRLYDVHNYCFATERYSNYRLGLLSDEEMRIVAYYFEQKYKDVFTYELVYDHTYSPSTSTTIVQNGGVYKAYQNSNNEAYKFCRKVPIVSSMGQSINTTQQ